MKKWKNFFSVSGCNLALAGCFLHKLFLLDELSYVIKRYSDLTVDIGFLWIKVGTNDAMYSFVDYPFIFLLLAVCCSAITIMWDEVAEIRKAWRENDAKTQDDSAS